MKAIVILSSAILLLPIGCSSGGRTPNPLTFGPPALAETRTYSGSAGFGDFLELTVDPNMLTISYQDFSTPQSGSVPFTLSSDGSYLLEDPTGSILTAYEVPNDLLLLTANNLVGLHTPALTISVPTAPVTVDMVTNRTLNYIHLQTSGGGFEIGSGNIDANGNIASVTFWPLGNSFEMIGRSPFYVGSLPALGIKEDPSGTYLTIEGVNGGSSYVVGDSNGYLINRWDGTYLALEQAASKEFDPINSGTYNMTLYQKMGATSTNGSDESGPSSFATGTLIIGVDGRITLTSAQKQILAQGTIEPVSDQLYLYNPDSIFTLSDPCYGLFTFQVESMSAIAGSPEVASANSTVPTEQSVFVTFRGHTAIIASFKKYFTPGSEGPYEYFYGLGER